MLILLTIFYKKYCTSYPHLKNAKNISFFFKKKNNFRFIIAYLCLFYKNQYNTCPNNNIFKKIIVYKIEFTTAFKKQSSTKLF